MQKKTTFAVTLPDNTVRTRKTHRAYSHVLAVFSVSWNATEPSWGVIGFCGSRALAEKSRNSWARRFAAGTPFAILECAPVAEQAALARNDGAQ